MDQCTICSFNRTKYAAQRPLFSLTLHALERAAAGFIDEVRHELSHRSSAKAHKLLHSLGGPYRREQSAVTNATASTSEADEHALCAAWYKNQLHMQRIHDKPGASEYLAKAQAAIQAIEQEWVRRRSRPDADRYWRKANLRLVGSGLAPDYRLRRLVCSWLQGRKHCKKADRRATALAARCYHRKRATANHQPPTT